MSKNNDTKMRNKNESSGITGITVSGYKSIAEEKTIKLGNLTILAGANSSGKSSMIQPLLLLKQTLELGYDPGGLLIDGNNVKFTSVSQLLSRSNESRELFVELEFDNEYYCGFRFAFEEQIGPIVKEMTITENKKKVTLRQGMKSSEIAKLVQRRIPKEIFGKNPRFQILQNRCFLNIGISSSDEKEPLTRFVIPPLSFLLNRIIADPKDIENHIRNTIHLPGLRGNPERVYPRSATGPSFPGTFENYTASVIAEWQSKGNEQKMKSLWADLVELGLTWKVSAKKVDDTRVSLQVGRLCVPAPETTNDLVDISDVGFGTSQALPILVALHTAFPGQLVFIEQPEMHLHPKAQYRLASVLANAAKKGVRVVVETHSALLLLGIQALVAKKKLDNELVRLHWFERREDGCTEITSADLDRSGAFGNWPEDFGRVHLDAQDDYLDARESVPKGE